MNLTFDLPVGFVPSSDALFIERELGRNFSKFEIRFDRRVEARIIGEWIESGGVQVPGQKFHKNVSSVGGEDGSAVDGVHAAAWNDRCRFPGNLSAPRGRCHSR